MSNPLANELSPCSKYLEERHLGQFEEAITK
jgi:hypothetical protein